MKKNKLIISCLLVMVSFSCKKVIEIKETDFINGEKAYQTVENTDQGAIGAYAAVIGEGNMYLNSILSDEVANSEFPTDLTVHNWLYAADDITLTRNNPNTFEINYRVIDRVNRVLAALPEADSTRAGDVQLRSRLRGEMLALRAYMHFELFRSYCDNYTPEGLALPYMETSVLGNQSRINMKPYFDKLNADLAEAKTLIPATFTDVYRITKNAVTGMQARVSLYVRNWAAAETFATEFITALPLAKDSAFLMIWKDSVNTEVAWKLRRTSLTTRPGSVFRGTSSTATNIGTVIWIPSSKLWDAYDKTNDIRFTAYLKDEPLLTAQGRNSRLVRKYEGTGYATAGENANDYKMFRTGEMYLIRAEARLEQDKIASAVQDLNDLRRARIKGYTDQTYADRTTLLPAIMEERFKELAFEGHRFWDLKRRSLPVERRVADSQGAAFTTLPANNLRFVLPIPFYEIQANRAMKQNTGY